MSQFFIMKFLTIFQKKKNQKMKMKNKMNQKMKKKKKKKKRIIMNKKLRF